MSGLRRAREDIDRTADAGVAYVGILLVLLVLSTLGFAFLSTVRTELSATVTRSTAMQAQYLAEAAANHAMWRLLNQPLSEGQVRIAHVDDDAQEKFDGHMELDKKEELGEKRYVGLRFLNVKIPQGTTITLAHVELLASDDKHDLTHLEIRGEDTDDAARFTAADSDIGNRAMTGAVVPWSSIPSWTKDEFYQTPDLSPIIQEIVNRPGWSSGSSLAILFESTLSSGKRFAYSYDESPATAPLLRVEYEGGGIAAIDAYYMHSLGGGRYGYKLRPHTDTTFATVATVGAIGDQVVHQSYVLHVLPLAVGRCQAEYVEDHQAWTATQKDSWQVIDLSEGPFYVPAHAVLEVAITNSAPSNQRKGGVRAVGSELDRWFELHEAEGGGVDGVVMHVQADAGSRIEYFSQDISNVQFTILGYWVCAHYVETFYGFRAGASGSWQDRALAPYGVGPDQVAEVVALNDSDGVDWQVGVRTDGSGLADRTAHLQEAEQGGEDAATMLVTSGGDANATIEVFAGTEWNIEFFLVGHWTTPPGTYTESESLLIGPLADQTWQDMDLSPYGVPGRAVAQIAVANLDAATENLMGLREKGSALQRDIELHDAEGGGSDNVSMHVNTDESSTLEGYHEDVSDPHSYRLLGFWECVDTYGKDLAGHWKLDDGSPSGTAADSSINGNDGALTGMNPETDWVAGVIDGALDFDGGNDHVRVPHDPSLSLVNQMTLAAWIRARSGSGLMGYDLLLNKGTAGDHQNYWLGTEDDEITFGFYNDHLEEFKTSGAGLATGTWYHIAATFNNAGDSVRIYLNGAELKSWSTSKEPLANTDDLYIGRSQYGEYWDGRLDDIRIYNRVLDQPEIQALYDAGN